MLDTTDSSLTDVPFVASIEDYVFVERIERAFRQLNSNPYDVPTCLTY